ncbi:ATP-binding protein [Haloferula sargassicola]|uniref:Helicase HerA central domain-containing protein n=1 Tax=Haloferula sargassicola TaxID=490096 RepID=A0ABP9UU00_9BACT
MDASTYEKLGSFYLGKTYDLDAAKPTDELVLYDSKDLVTHGVVLGMTGSGKTGLCMALLEEAALDHIPAIVIDPKGDIANLLLNFPDLKGSDFRPWINEDDATRKGVTPDEFAEKTAGMWKNGLADWGQSPERVKTLRDSVDVNIFTPGSNAGIPVSILASLAAPPFEVVDDGELFGERIESTVASLLSLVGVDADPIQSPEAILLANVFSHEWKAGRDLSLETLIRHLQKPPFDKIGVLDLESFISTKDRQELALKFNAMLASPGFQTWLEGPALDIAKMMHAPDGKPRISIFSIAHLSDSERMFFVSLLLNQMLGWMRQQSGTTSLRALLYMDEIYGYLPPTANPPSKKPMMTMLKQARAFGLGCLLATQNPVDLDYKALSNIGTWFLGRLQTERDKLRVLDGLEGAAASQNSKFNRAAMETLLSGLGNRVFLLNNVHEDGPVLFHVRWVMSYLAGPLTRGSIKKLMDPKRDTFGNGSGCAGPAQAVAGPARSPSSNPMSMGPPTSVPPPSARPIVGPGVLEHFAPVAGSTRDVTYQPHLLRVGTVRFSSTKAGIDASRTVRKVNPVTATGIDWDHEVPPPLKPEELGNAPTEGAGFGELPGFAMNADNYKAVDKEFADWLYDHERADIFCCKELKEYSQLGESEADFRARLSHAAREARDEAVEKLRDKAEAKLKTLENRLRTAEASLEREKGQATSAKLEAGMSIVGSLLGGILGGRRRSARTSVSRAGRAFQQHRDVNLAEDKVEAVEADMEELKKDLEADIAELDRGYDPSALDLDTETLKPTRANVQVDRIALLWLPYDDRGNPAW